MLETKVPKDIRVYKTKLVGGLTFRQFLCVVLMILFDLLLYNTILKQTEISIEYIIFVLIFLDVPIAAFGWLAPTKRKATHKIVETQKKVPETKKEKRQRKRQEKKNPELKGFK